MKAEILTILKDTDGYVSGQELCERFGVSRTAVWKAMNQLKKEGYEIESVQNKGYHLVKTPDILSKNELVSIRKTKWVGTEICYFDVTDSTNTQAKSLARERRQTVRLSLPESRRAAEADGAEALSPLREPAFS